MGMTCPTCGAIFKPEIQFSGRLAQLIFDCIRKRPGCTIDNIVEYVYGIHGGIRRKQPDDPRPVINATIYRNIKPVLAKHGYELRTQRGPGATYTLIKVIPDGIL